MLSPASDFLQQHSWGPEAPHVTNLTLWQRVLLCDVHAYGYKPTWPSRTHPHFALARKADKHSNEIPQGNNAGLSFQDNLLSSLLNTIVCSSWGKCRSTGNYGWFQKPAEVLCANKTSESLTLYFNKMSNKELPPASCSNKTLEVVSHSSGLKGCSTSTRIRNIQFFP